MLLSIRTAQVKFIISNDNVFLVSIAGIKHTGPIRSGGYNLNYVVFHHTIGYGTKGHKFRICLTDKMITCNPDIINSYGITIRHGKTHILVSDYFRILNRNGMYGIIN